MILSRNQFFLLLLTILIGVFVAYKMAWLSNAKKTNGMVYFMGHTLELNGSISSHLVILFKAGVDTVTFNADPNLGYHRGDIVPVRYQKDNPSDARVDIPIRIWGDTFVYALAPFLILFVLFFTPDSLDPVIPKKTKVVLGKKSFIKFILQPKQNSFSRE